MKAPREDEIRIATEAAEWQHALRKGGTEERAQFVDWLRASPRHLREFLYMEALEAATQNVDAQRRFDVERLTAQASGNVVTLSNQDAPTPALPRKWGREKWLAGIAAAVAIVGVGVWLIERSANTYATAVGEQRSLELEDGSIVELNAQSRVEVHLSPNAREVKLLAGEAMFKVARDSSRLFRVHAGATVIRVLGTQFNVNRRTSGTTVSVLEGKVAVDEAQLTAGDEVHVADNGRITRKALDPVEVTDWRQRRLVFRDDTLEDIAAEFNRYNKRPRILVEGAIARAKRFGGTFDADDPQSITQVLAGNSALTIERTDDAIVIRAR